jgi:nicotinamide mononucleotide (NMN) deamidase PncC
MSFSESEKDYTDVSLEDYARSLIDKNLNQEPDLRSSVCIAVAGGGGYAISTLAATCGASSMLLEGAVTYDRRSYRSYVGLTSNNTRISYNSLEAAKLASETALKRAMNFKTQKLKQMNGCVGIGSASALVSTSSPDTVKGSGYVVATRADGSQLSISFSLASKAESNNRSRKDEDIFISHLILRSIELIQQPDSYTQKRTQTQTNAGDIIVEEWGTPVARNVPDEDTAYSAAQRLLDGDEQALVLLPVYKEGQPVAFKALRYPVIPNGSLVMPGSFNPPHKGHISLGQAAVRAAERMGYSSRHEELPIFMELSLTNADKPPIDPKTASERIRKFLTLEDMPKQWGLVLTRAPLFSQKLTCLQDCIMERADGKHGKISFVIGADTLARILNPKYYNDDKDQMIAALMSMRGAHFFAGGRVEQKESPDGAQFITGKDELSGLPQELKDKFTIIDEQEFRVDISSTEIRQKEAERLAAGNEEG